jgi:hypothetical protein
LNVPDGQDRALGQAVDLPRDTAHQEAPDLADAPAPHNDEVDRLLSRIVEELFRGVTGQDLRLQTVEPFAGRTGLSGADDGLAQSRHLHGDRKVDALGPGELLQSLGHHQGRTIT